MRVAEQMAELRCVALLMVSSFFCSSAYAANQPSFAFLL